ncbi:MAG: hypothetical protein ACXVFK_03005 [Solirubrobacteraceae bacterium]
MPSRPSYLELPEGWSRVEASGPGPFVTREVLERPDGTRVQWRSRAHRKRDANRWVAALFALGAACFAIASIASQWASAPRSWIGPLFFAGSVLFTGGGFAQYWEVVNVQRTPQRDRSLPRRRPASWEPRRIDWAAAVIQLAGTLFFNVSTFAAMKQGLSAEQADLRVWTPDVAGSICFLASSELSFAEVCHRWVCLRPRTRSWTIVALNLVGSIAFGASAIAALVVPSSDEPVNAAVANATTTAGALCFLCGALLLRSEAARARAATPA